jgi:hypothetical protein
MRGADTAAELIDVSGYGALVSRAVPDVSPARLDVWPTGDFSVVTGHAAASGPTESTRRPRRPIQALAQRRRLLHLESLADPDLFAASSGAGG